MTAKRKFENGLDKLKNGTIGAVVATLLMATVIPVGGLLAHGVKYLGDERLNNYSLKNRFETAYSFKTPDKNKYYSSTPVINGYEQESTKEKYLATPYATYGLMGAAGLAGLFAGMKVTNKRKENQR